MDIPATHQHDCGEINIALKGPIPTASQARTKSVVIFSVTRWLKWRWLS
jgi:hypothetical protein